MAKSRTKSKSAPRGRYSIGVDLGGTNVRAGLVSGDRLIKLEARPIRSQGTKEEVFEDLCAVIAAVMDDRASGIGIGAPSLLDPKTGIIHDTTNIPSWKKVPLKTWVEKKFKLPVRMDNDANCFALGERYFGHGREHRNFVGLITGTGLGAGIISNGRLHSGVDCGAGEFGMIPYRDSILEHYAAGQFFSRAGTDGARLDVEAEEGDPRALRIFAEYGQHLGFAMKTILYSLAPEMIVLGGSVSRSYKFYKDSLKDSLKDFVYPSVLRQLTIKTSSVKHVAVLGAATLLRDDNGE